MFPPPLRTAVAVLIASVAAGAALHAQQYLPPVDVNKMLKDLKGLQDQDNTQLKSLKQAALQQISPAASSPASAVALWEQAVRATQMEGAGKEGTTFKAWRDTDGEVLKEREVQEAISLSMSWLALTLQRSNGTPVKDLLSSIVSYTNSLLQHQVAMEQFEEKFKAERELEKSEVGPKRDSQRKLNEVDANIKRVHDSILNQELASNLVVRWLKLGGYLDVQGWEQNPGDFDGIYGNIVQPELRSELSPRVFEYWDAKLKTEADRASRSKLTYEIDKFNTLRRPSLLWGRAEEFAYLGQTNRAATEMYNVIKAYPTHPDAQEWIAELQKMIAPSSVTAPTATPAAPAALPSAATRPVQ